MECMSHDQEYDFGMWNHWNMTYQTIICVSIAIWLCPNKANSLLISSQKSQKFSDWY